VKTFFAILAAGLVIATVSAAGQTITVAEYFINTDPGPGNGTPIDVSEPGAFVSFSVSVPPAAIAALPDGSHRLVARVQDDSGAWSVAFARTFYKSESTVPPEISPIVAAEYYLNEDPGPGNGTAIPVTEGESVSLTVEVPPAALAALPDGVHQIAARTMNARGDWSIAFRRTFIKTAQFDSRDFLVSRIEYRWYKDGEPASEVFELAPETPENPVSFQQLASLAGLIEGETYRLHFVPYDDEGGLGFPVTTPEIVIETVDSNGDGIPDHWKLTYGFDIMDDIAHIDTNGDGLTNLEEFLYGTNPLLLDTSGDGIPDGLAVRLRALGIDPLVNNPALVAALATFAAEGDPNLFSAAQFQALAMGHPVIAYDPESKLFTLRLGLQKSVDLISYDPFPFHGPSTEVNENGEIEFRFLSPAEENAAFYRIEAR
jgi:hypothetical protein